MALRLPTGGLNKLTASTLEQIAKQLEAKGIPANVTSAFRDAAHNKDVGGAKGSQHLSGKAVDLSLKGLDDAQKQTVVDTVQGNPSVRGFGYYPKSDSIHFDTRGGERTAWGSDYTGKTMGKGWPSWMTERTTNWRSGKQAPSTESQMLATVPGVQQAAYKAPTPKVAGSKSLQDQIPNPPKLDDPNARASDDGMPEAPDRNAPPKPPAEINATEDEIIRKVLQEEQLRTDVDRASGVEPGTDIVPYEDKMPMRSPGRALVPAGGREVEVPQGRDVVPAQGRELSVTNQTEAGGGGLGQAAAVGAVAGGATAAGIAPAGDPAQQAVDAAINPPQFRQGQDQGFEQQLMQEIMKAAQQTITQNPQAAQAADGVAKQVVSQVASNQAADWQRQEAARRIAVDIDKGIIPRAALGPGGPQDRLAGTNPQLEEYAASMPIDLTQYLQNGGYGGDN